MHRRSKGAGETITYKVDFSAALAQSWQPGVSYSLAEYVTPPVPNGFEYECTDAGQTDHDEPDWPTAVGVTVENGSVQWTCRDFAGNAYDAINTQQATANKAGITVASVSAIGRTVLVRLTGGTAYQTYDITVQITSDAGEIYEEIIRVTVTE